MGTVTGVFTVLHGLQHINMEVTYADLPALPGACQEGGHVGGAVSTPVCTVTKNKPGGGGQTPKNHLKTSMETSLGPHFPGVHWFDNTNWLGTQ